MLDQPRTLPQRLDDLSKRSGLYRLTMIDEGPPRTLRWQPVGVLVAMTLGYALTITAIDTGITMLAVGIVGGILFFGGFIVSSILRVRGPRLRPTMTGRLDERERSVKARAGQWSGVVFTVLAIVGCFYLGAAQAFGLWAPRTPVAWFYLGLLLEGWALTLPVLFASWLQPRELPDEDVSG